MNRRLTAAMHAVRLVGERPDPFEPVAVGAIATRLSLSLSGASRLCADLERTGLLERAEVYGSYRVGLRSVALSGRAAAPFAQAVRFALTRASTQTGETVCVAAGSGDGARIVAAVVSAWTLHAPAQVGELVETGESAIAVALSDSLAGADGPAPAVLESVIGMRMEVATPIRDASGRTVAVVAVRLPSNRRRSGGARARRAVKEASRAIERAIAAAPVHAGTAAVADRVDERVPAIDAAATILDRLADGPDTVTRLSRAIGLRADRTQRLVESCVAAGLVRAGGDGRLHLTWAAHGWHRAAVTPVVERVGAAQAAAIARRTAQCTFVTVLRGMRSVTLVEKLAGPGEGLALAPWIGRPCPIIYADGGPTLLMDFDLDQIAPLLPGTPSRAEVDELLERVRWVAKGGVLTKGSAEAAGQIAVSAPVRDASGTVVAAACIVGATDAVRPRIRELEDAVLELAAVVSAALGHPRTVPMAGIDSAA